METMPVSAKLRSTGIATAKNGCHKIIIWQGA